jgi:Fur family zinc uptake transcriptional regulator
MPSGQHVRSAAAQTAALAEAEAGCKVRGQIWTAPSRRTYELLLAAGAPRAAYELMGELKRGGQYVGPATGYCALDFLIAMGVAHRAETRKGAVICGRPLRCKCEVGLR